MGRLQTEREIPLPFSPSFRLIKKKKSRTDGCVLSAASNPSSLIVQPLKIFSFQRRVTYINSSQTPEMVFTRVDGGREEKKGKYFVPSPRAIPEPVGWKEKAEGNFLSSSLVARCLPSSSCHPTHPPSVRFCEVPAKSTWRMACWVRLFGAQ